MKKCLLLSLSLLSLTILLSLLYFNPTSVSLSISISASPSLSPSRAPRVLRRRPARATHVPLTSPSLSLSFLFSPNHTLYSQLALWTHMRDLLSRPDTLPAVSDGAREASIAFKSLLASLSKQKDLSSNNSMSDKESCPYTVQSDYPKIDLPCGLAEDSTITIVGVPIAKNGSSQFGIELIGSDLGTKEVAKRPIVLSWNVSLDPKQSMIYQNFWLPESGWGELDSCPNTRPISTGDGYKVDGLVRCNQQQSESIKNQQLVNRTEMISNEQSKRPTRRSHLAAAFPFIEGHPFTATLWNGVEGFHMTVNGRHETSYRYRERLEPWSVTEVRVLGDLDLLSAFVNGLPVMADDEFNSVDDLRFLKAPLLDTKKEIFLLVGVFSTANNFKRRMAIRRSWMQYEAVRSGAVVVRFFTGLHKSDNVNLELWREAELYGDVQIMPFVDYYSLITLKTVAICIFGTKIGGAKYIMKTDDDAFVRIDEIISILGKLDSTALLYGLISFQSSPHRDKDSKWFVSPEEWSNESYPPWAHGPGYIISKDIADFIVQGHEERYLQLFKLEDVAMGIWIEDYKNTGQEINYVSDDRFYNEGCESDYILAHYQSPRLLLCLWSKLQKDHRPFCCE
ncbi:hypothetical protein LUZ63_019014 [Rhynchospora breviuscula]|uniref:Galectin domain-containing protein n=1 Tax=Rhynchospora breviuscula TaxID=2022672 RepID=A0A9Q0C5E6_9POAL|nr:hypothetical protein LUZ63_019014 [Rhynchospora breviuscula]